jgi:UDP-GlcNAc:undecaprenyl-phosphate/decaprenyl-phosphate GlcNAc-1-phosphate transferase
MLTLVVAAAVTYLLTPVARRIALRWGALTPVRDRDVHAIPTPRLGGIAMLGGFGAGMLVATQMPFLGPRLHDARQTLPLLAGAGLICLLGIADDRWELDALTKLAGQVLAAGVMVIGGVQMLYLPIGLYGSQSEVDGKAVATSFVLGPVEGTVFTIVLVVATVNAVNFVDGLDGLAAGIVAIAAAAFFVFSYALTVTEGLTRATTSGVVAAALIGVCVGFLPHNFSPARVFMGDSGSMVLGLLLASTTVTLTGTVGPNAVTTPLGPALLPLVLPIAVMALPFLDVVFAFVRRTAAGQSPFAPDKKHLHHRLLERGHSHARAVLVMYLWSAVLAFGWTASGFLKTPALVVSLVAACVVAVLLTMNIPRLRRSEGSFTGLRRGRVR